MLMAYDDELMYLAGIYERDDTFQKLQFSFIREVLTQ